MLCICYYFPTFTKEKCFSVKISGISSIPSTELQKHCHYLYSFGIYINRLPHVVKLSVNVHKHLPYKSSLQLEHPLVGLRVERVYCTLCFFPGPSNLNILVQMKFD